jgi:hypothetical protein
MIDVSLKYCLNRVCIFFPESDESEYVNPCNKPAFKFWIFRNHSIACSCEEHGEFYEQADWKEITQDEFDTTVFMRS